jgi:hypothetical protein
MRRKPWALYLLIRGTEVLFGAYLLWTILPLKRPWLMERVQLGSCGQFACVRVAPAFLGQAYVWPLAAFLRTSALIFALSIVFDERLRALLARMARTRTLGRTVTALALLGLTLYPSSELGSGVVLYLWLGTIGVTWTVAGVVALCAQTQSESDAAARAGTHLVASAAAFARAAPACALVAGAFGLELCLTNLASAKLFDHVPHVPDGVTQLFHARILATGAFTARTPALPEFFRYPHMIMTDRWYSQYPPGHIFSLLLGVWVGVPWLVNPVLGSLTIALLYPLGKELYGESTARLSLLLGLLSPFVLFMSSEFMNHATALFTLTLALLFFARMVRTRSATDGLLCGASFGWMAVTRPLSAAATAVPFVLFAARLFWREPRRCSAAMIGLLSAGLFAIVLMLAFNFETTGSPMLSGYQALHGPGDMLGFGHSGGEPPHTAAQGLSLTLKNLNAINKYLFEWPIPGLTFVAALFVSRRAKAWDFLLLASFAALVVAYFFYWFQDWCFGPRYLYESTTALILLTARGILELPALLAEHNDSLACKLGARRVVAGLLCVCIVVAAVGNVPALVTRYGASYWGVSAHVLHWVKAARLENALVFTQEDFGGVFHANDPDLGGKVIFARDRGAHDWDLAARYRGRSYWIAGAHGLTPLGRRPVIHGVEQPDVEPTAKHSE